LTENFDKGWRIEATLGAVQGATVKEIFDRLVAAERLADWEAARAEHGESATVLDLERTEAQRRADAFVVAFTQAAAQPADAIRPEPAVTVLFSHDAFEKALAELAGQNPEPLDPRTYRTYRCETLDGTPLVSTEALAAMLVGHTRRVVLGAAEASMSQKARVFTGPLRKLLNVLDTTCIWPGCEQPSHRCQADHTTPWRETRDTSVRNGAVLCGSHNRFKEHGYRTWRDPGGRWHLQRPDGTEVQPAA
jgi:hypothetical protein